MIVFSYNDGGGNRAAADDALVWRGQWSSGGTYNQFDWVRYQGDNYIALTASTNAVPGSSTAWALLVQISPSGLTAGTSVITSTVLPFTWNNTQLLDVKVFATGTNWVTLNGSVVWTGTLNGTATGSNVGALIILYGST